MRNIMEIYAYVCFYLDVKKKDTSTCARELVLPSCEYSTRFPAAAEMKFALERLIAAALCLSLPAELNHGRHSFYARHKCTHTRTHRPSGCWQVSSSTGLLSFCVFLHVQYAIQFVTVSIRLKPTIGWPFVTSIPNYPEYPFVFDFHAPLFVVFYPHPLPPYTSAPMEFVCQPVRWFVCNVCGTRTPNHHRLNHPLMTWTQVSYFSPHSHGKTFFKTKCNVTAHLILLGFTTTIMLETIDCRLTSSSSSPPQVDPSDSDRKSQRGSIKTSIPRVGMTENN